MEKRWFFILIICLVAAIEFFVSNEALKGYLRSEITLAKEVKTPLETIDEYRIAEQAPFKYRLLFPTIIKGSYNLVYNGNDNLGFFYTYRFWSMVFYITSACSMFWLLLNVGFNNQQSLVGTMTFLFLPPMLLAFTLPVHTREDTLAYTLFFAGLALLIKEKRWPFMFIALAGVVARETLLLLPLLYFFFAKDESVIRRFFIAGLPLLLWTAIRIFMGYQDYDVWEGLRWNLNNPEQVIGFLFITFNFLWLPFLLHLVFFKKNIHYTPQDLRFFYRSSVFALVIILLTTFFGGIYNEIRLLYLFAPWMIIIFLDFIRNYNSSLKITLGTRNYWMFCSIAFLVCASVLILALQNREKLIVPGKYAVPYDQWIILSVCYIFILLLFLPHSMKIFSLKKPVK
jgi:hypothetical protein